MFKTAKKCSSRWLLLAAVCSCTGKVVDVTVGFVFPFDCDWGDFINTHAAAVRAVHRSSRYANFRLRPLLFDDKDNAADGVYVMANVTSMKIPLILGPSLSSVATASRPFMNRGQAVILSPSAVSSQLSDSVLFPTFSRVIPAAAAKSLAVRVVLQKYGWRQFCILSGIWFRCLDI